MSKRKSDSIMQPLLSTDDEYKKLTDLQHLLTRPDQYVGQMKKTEVVDWVINSELRMEERKLNISPAAVKVFDEVLVNARDQSEKFPDLVTKINVNINRETGLISVENNGPGIPIKIHSEHNVYIPQMIFGNSKPVQTSMILFKRKRGEERTVQVVNVQMV